MGKNPFDDFAKALNLKNSLAKTPLGPVMKALDKPYQAAIATTAKVLKGTPLETTANAFVAASTGHVKESIAMQAEGALNIVKAYVPEIASIPGIGLATDAAKSLINGAVGVTNKGAGGVGAIAAKIPDLATVQAIVGPASALAPLLKPQASTPVPGPVTPTRTPQTSLPAAVMAVATVSNVPPAKPPPPGRGLKPKPARTFTPAQWRSLCNDPRSVGGTQPWNVP